MEVVVTEEKNIVEVMEQVETIIIEEAKTQVIVSGPEITIVSVIETEIVDRRDERISVVSIPITERIAIGDVGPQGIPGPVGSTDVSYSAGESLGGHRAVIIDDDMKAYYGSNTNLQHANKIMGVTKGAVEADAPASIKTWGEMVEPSWSWAPDIPIFLGQNGLLTQVPPTVGFSLIMGFPIGGNKMFIDIKQPIILN